MPRGGAYLVSPQPRNTPPRLDFLALAYRKALAVNDSGAWVVRNDLRLIYQITVASFQDSPHCPPWPRGRPRAVVAYGAVRKCTWYAEAACWMNTHEHCVFCSCATEMSKPHQQAFSPHISRGYSAQQNSQPIICYHLMEKYSTDVLGLRLRRPRETLNDFDQLLVHSAPSGRETGRPHVRP